MGSDLVWFGKIVAASLGLAFLIKTLGTQFPLPDSLGMVWLLLLLPSALMILILGFRQFTQGRNHPQRNP